MSADLIEFTLTINRQEPTVVLALVQQHFATLVHASPIEKTLEIQQLRTFDPVER